jgi:hypothetical protein
MDKEQLTADEMAEVIETEHEWFIATVADDWVGLALYEKGADKSILYVMRSDIEGCLKKAYDFVMKKP